MTMKSRKTPQFWKKLGLHMGPVRWISGKGPWHEVGRHARCQKYLKGTLLVIAFYLPSSEFEWVYHHGWFFERSSHAQKMKILTSPWVMGKTNSHSQTVTGVIQCMSVYSISLDVRDKWCECDKEDRQGTDDTNEESITLGRKKASWDKWGRWEWYWQNMCWKTISIGKGASR